MMQAAYPHVKHETEIIQTHFTHSGPYPAARSTWTILTGVNKIMHIDYTLGIITQ